MDFLQPPKTLSCKNVYIDGSCVGPQKNRQAGCGVFFEQNDIRNVSEKLSEKFTQTNNVAELMGIVRALETILNTSSPLQTHNDTWNIHSDSKYAISCVTNWAIKWQKNEWRKSDGNPILNRHIIEKILSLLSEFPNKNVHFIYIPREENKEADKLAKIGATSSKAVN